MQRHPALQDLSRDHFTALNQVVRVARVRAGDRFAESVDEVRAGFLAFARGGLMDHFVEEETDLVGPLERVGADRVLERFRSDHARIREGLAALSESSSVEALWAVAEALRVHVRWEEEVMFETVQSALSEAELDALWRASRTFRSEHGMPVGPA